MAQVQLPVVPGRLYRYRSLTRSSNALRRELESIRKMQLYCSEFTQMNDPMEGFFRPSRLLRERSDFERVVGRLVQGKSQLGIACFTETRENVLMWTHYAGNYSGICIAYSGKDLIAGLPDDVSIVRVSYVDEPALIYPRHIADADAAAIRLLSQKKYNWAYEREWRVLATLGKVSMRNVQAIKAVYLGSRVSTHHREKILEELKDTDIKVYAMEIDGYEHSWKRCATPARPNRRRKRARVARKNKG